MKSAQDPRHLHRQKVMQELFAFNTHVQKVSDETVEKIIKLQNQIDEFVTTAAPEWTIDKINKVDLAILRLATYELVFEHAQPAKVIIDEAVELAKEFGGESSPNFVNGALAKILTSPKRTLRIIADKLGVEIEKLTPQSVLTTDLNASELEVSDLTTQLMKDLSLQPESKFTTVGDILDFIEDNA